MGAGENIPCQRGFIMRFFLKNQLRKDSDSLSSIKINGYKLVKKINRFIAGFEANVREVFLFSASLIFLLFNLLERHTDKKVDRCVRR